MDRARRAGQFAMLLAARLAGVRSLDASRRGPSAGGPSAAVGWPTSTLLVSR